MGFMDKVKNLFTEEVEVEEPIKKEMIQVEIPAPVKKEETKMEVIGPEKKEEEIPKEEEKKEEFNFPFFDDDDFSEIPPKEEEPKKEKKKVKKEREIYSKPKEEKKVFKPTPIISPVYGILDKNYNKDDIKKTTKPRSYYNPKEATVDEIRNKAYGTLEDDIETTLFGRNHLMFDELPQEKETSRSVKSEEYDDNLIGEKPRHGVDLEPELTDLLEEEMGKEANDEKPKKISDRELFNMIDSMYQKGDKK